MKARLTDKGAPAVDTRLGVPTAEKLTDGQFADHWVLTEAERKRGFVRPVRHSYRHVGPPGPRHPLRSLTADEKERFGSGYVKFEEYPPEEFPKTGRLWSKSQLDAAGQGCGTITHMPIAIAETYARQPDFYGTTFCAHCRRYLPVGVAGEFVWDDDGSRVGT